tara:strand:- start:186 stop:914 length:729 start_codon:yes stop_codon:yes gene_type:complete
MSIDKIVEYGGIKTHVSVPLEPSGLAFIMPGYNMHKQDTFLLALRHGAMGRQAAVVCPDFSDLELCPRDRRQAYKNFIPAVEAVINGYFEDKSNYRPDSFEIIAHSAGAAASLHNAKDYNLSQLTLLDMTIVPPEWGRGLDCPLHIITSSYLPCERSGANLYKRLRDNNQHNTHTQFDTKKDFETGHCFREVLPEIRRLVTDLAPPAISRPDLSGEELNEEELINPMHEQELLIPWDLQYER